MDHEITRRTFVRGTLVGGASLLVPLFVTACARGRGSPRPRATEYTITDWIAIRPSGRERTPSRVAPSRAGRDLSTLRRGQDDVSRAQHAGRYDPRRDARTLMVVLCPLVPMAPQPGP